MQANDKVSRFEQAEQSPGFMLWQVTNLWQRELRKALAKYGLTHAQFVLLASLLWLSQHQENVTQIELANHCKMDAMTTSTVLRTLQQRGLLQRAENKADTRSKILTLTKKGIKLVNQAVVVVESFDAQFFHPLGKGVKEFNQKLQALLKS
jgi:DNA-binding MarR family transcriptional regulator